jgi:hypothetical protein
MVTEDVLLTPDERTGLDALVSLREQLRLERAKCMSPAVEQALNLADVYLFLALGYLGYCERLFPEQQ